jgi:SAM-dependent methyltransferase
VRQADQLRAIAHRRLYPSLTEPNYLVLRARRLIFTDWIAQLPGSKLRILDVGGRYQPYRPLLNGRIEQYTSVDLLRTELVDVVASGEALPFQAETFDLVIATQVFDCFRDPCQAAMQIHRVLKPGGVLLMSVAAVAPRFADEEHWRFLPAGIRYVLSAFSKVEISPEVYSLGGLCRTLNVALNSFAKFGAVRKAFGVTLCPALNLLGLGLEWLKLTENDQFTPNYSVLARKA